MQLSFGGQESGSVFSIAVQSSKCYVESLPLELKEKRSCFSQGERFAVQLPLDHALALRKYNAKLARMMGGKA